MKIVIIGAGLAGSALSYYLGSSHEVVVYDKGEGASHTAAGLMHPFTGLEARKNRLSDAGMEMTRQLLQIVGMDRPTGILRPAINSERLHWYTKTAAQYEEAELWDEEKVARIKGAVKAPGLFIRSGYTINIPEYLKRLKEMSQAQFVQESAPSLNSIEADRIFLAPGADIVHLANLQLRLLKGQILRIQWPDTLPPLPFPLSGSCYVVPEEASKTAIVGATFERSFANLEPDINVAKEYLLPKLKELIPSLAHPKILECKAAIRVSTPGHMPCLKQVSEKTWALTGMGSKGLLYHALFASKASHIC